VVPQGRPLDFRGKSACAWIDGLAASGDVSWRAVRSEARRISLDHLWKKTQLVWSRFTGKRQDVPAAQRAFDAPNASHDERDLP